MFSEKQKYKWANAGVSFLWLVFGLWIFLIETQTIIAGYGILGEIPYVGAVFIGLFAVYLTVWALWSYECRVINRAATKDTWLAEMELEAGLEPFTDLDSYRDTIR